MSSKTAAIFGGTFDPVHEGHLKLAEDVGKSFKLDRVVFTPCFQSPFKGPTYALAAQRYDMLNIAIEEKGWDWAEVSKYEICRPGPSYSWQTAEHFQELSPDTKWFWILGTDQWEQIEEWVEPDWLRDHLSFIVVTRDGTKVKNRPGWDFDSFAFSHPGSSTKIRENYPEHRSWLSPGVREYCVEHELYVHGHP